MNTLFRNRILLLALFCFSAFAVTPPLKVGEAAPNLADFKFDGTVPDTKGRVVLVDFWASWCVPCRKSFPVLKSLHEKYGSRGLVIVGISVDEERRNMDEFLKKYPAPFAVVRDSSGKSPGAFRARTMPTSFIIGADGKIVAVHSGFVDATAKEYQNEIEDALKAAGK